MRSVFVSMQRNQRNNMLSFKQFIAERKDINLDLGAYGGWLNVKSGKVVNVGFEKHTAPEVLDKLGFDKKYRANIGSGFAHEKIMKHPWVKLIYPTKNSKTWAVQANKKYAKQLWKWLGPWLKDTEDRVYVDDDRSLRLGKFDLNLPKDMRAIKQMMEQFIVEKPAKLRAVLPYTGSKEKEIRGLINPSESDLSGFIYNAPNNAVRILVDKTGKLYVWGATHAIHREIIVGGDLVKDDVMLGEITGGYEDYNWEIQLSRKDGRDNYAKKNKTLAKLMKDKNNEVSTY